MRSQEAVRKSLGDVSAAVRHRGPILARGLVILVAVAMTAILTVADVEAKPPEERDFFGTVVSVGDGMLVVSTKDGSIEVPISEDTKFRLPKKHDARFEDLLEGDLVAVSLEDRDGRLVADKLFVIPGKTQHRAVPGLVTAVSDTEITIQPLREGADPITFARTPDTKVHFRKGATDIVEGLFVVVGAVRDPLTGELSSEALGIQVTAGKPRSAAREVREKDAEPLVETTVEIRGVFEGLDEQGNLVVGGKKILVDSDTAIDAGLVAGQVVEIDAELTAEGAVLARSVEGKEEDPGVSRKTGLQGRFRGVDDEGNWIVGGTKVAVDSDTDTDGLPTIGQRIKVKALLQDDGSLLAREIENKGGPLQPDEKGQVGELGQVGEKGEEAKLEGTFQGVDEKGNWLINGAAVSVGPQTKLEGTPIVGERIEVKAVVQDDGSLLAEKVEGGKGKLRGGRSEAKVRGVVEEVKEDGTLIVNGRSVAIGVLTELDGEPQVGDYVEIRALLQKGGSLLAREVESKGKLEAQDLPDASKVEIEGTIDKVNEDGTLVVNGVTVATGNLSEISGDLTAGASVKIEGFLKEDGSLLANKLKGEGRKASVSGTEVKVEGLVESINLDESGKVVSVVVDGLTVGVGALTRTEADLEPGAEVKIKAIISDGEFLASKIDERREHREAGGGSEVKIEGAIEAIKVNDAGQITGVTVNGLEVAVEALGKLADDLKVGESIDIRGVHREGAVFASKLDSEEPRREKAESSEFELQGLVESINRDEAGNVVSVVVDGVTVAAEALTRFKGEVERGSNVEVKGVIHGKAFLAEKIEIGKPEATAGEVSREIKIEGVIDGVKRDDQGNVVSVTVQGIEVAVEALSNIEGALKEGGRVEIEAAVRDGVIHAARAEGKQEPEGEHFKLSDRVKFEEARRKAHEVLQKISGEAQEKRREAEEVLQQTSGLSQEERRKAEEVLREIAERFEEERHKAEEVIRKVAERFEEERRKAEQHDQTTQQQDETSQRQQDQTTQQQDQTSDQQQDQTTQQRDQTSDQQQDQTTQQKDETSQEQHDQATQQKDETSQEQHDQTTQQHDQTTQQPPPQHQG